MGDLGDVFIVAGDYNLNVDEEDEISVPMLKYNIHPNFDEVSIQNDICTIILSENLQLDGVKYVLNFPSCDLIFFNESNFSKFKFRVDKVSLRRDSAQPGTNAVQIGWNDFTGPLEKVRLDIISDSGTYIHIPKKLSFPILI